MKVARGKLKLFEAIFELNKIFGWRKLVFVFQVFSNLLRDLMADQLFRVKINTVDVDEGLGAVMQTLANEFGLTNSTVTKNKDVCMLR